MKSIVLGLALLCAAPVFALDKAKSKAAGDACNPQIVQSCPDCEGHWVYPCANHTVKYRGCIEGELSYDTILNPGGYYEDVAVRCHNGTFHGQPAAVKHRGCKNGEIAYDQVMGAGGYYEQVTIVCKNNRFVRR